MSLTSLAHHYNYLKSSPNLKIKVSFKSALRISKLSVPLTFGQVETEKIEVKDTGEHSCSWCLYPLFAQPLLGKISKVTTVLKQADFKTDLTYKDLVKI